MKIQYSGIMTTYQCSAECAHCLYCSAPGARSGFMGADTARRIGETLRGLGTHSVHIGGGEPLLNVDSLREAISALRGAGVAIDYIETNAFWYRDDSSARDLIRELGAPIMVSVDPFHAEFVPLERPFGLIRLLGEMGWEHFVWQERYLRRLSHLGRSRRLTRAELRAALGEAYLIDAAREYGLSANGRALTILREHMPLRAAEELLDSRPCAILDGRHCHVDLYGNFVPPGCPGIGIDISDIASGEPDPEKYPVASALLRGGVSALWEYARARGFSPEGGYVSKCELCYSMREYLERTAPSRDVAPGCFYESMRADYARQSREE